jgi:hypothetical protein
MDVYGDGIYVGTIDQQGDRSAEQLRWDYPGSLSSGSHVLKLVYTAQGRSSKTSVSLDAVIVR